MDARNPADVDQEARMRLLIAQGPGHYGVNIRILTNEEGEAIGTVLDKVPDDAQSVIAGLYTTMMEDGTALLLTGKIDISKSTGFDSGWWTEGEKALDAIIEKARIYAAEQLNRSKRGME